MRISVVLCTYNGEKFIASQLESILSQNVAVDEIIISDDGSADKTLQIAEEVLSKGNIAYKIIKNDAPKGVALNFLSALKQASGDYCFTCDQDDVWFSDKTEKFINAANSSGKELYFSDGVLTDADGVPLGTNLWAAYGITIDKLGEHSLVNTLLRQAVVTGAAMMVSRTLIERVAEIPFGILHDEWFSMLAAVSHSAVPINCSTFYYRQHGNNVVGAKRRNFAEKAAVWYSNLFELEKIRGINCARIKALSYAAAGTQYEDSIKPAVEFWETLNDFSRCGRIKLITTATKLFFKKQYTAYYTGLRGYVRDILSLILPRK